MANNYFTASNQIVRHALARAEQVRGEFESIERAFDRLPEPAAISQGFLNYLVGAGTATAYTAAFAIQPPTAYTPGMSVTLKVPAANTGAATLDLNELGPRAIKRSDGSTPAAGDLSGLIELRYDGTNWVLMSAARTDVTNAAASAAAAIVAHGAAENARDASQYARDASQAARDASQTAQAASEAARNLSQDWAEKATAPGGAGTKSAKTHAGEAASSASAAATSASGAATSKTGADTAKAAAETARNKAQDWADKGEDLTVETGKYSAKHHALKAAASAAAAATDRSTASTKASEASASAAAAAASYDAFDDRFLGAKASQPTVDNDGNALLTGALFFDTTAQASKIWDGTKWVSTLYNSSNVQITGGSITGLSTLQVGTNNVWHPGNDGAGSNLDADRLDGLSSEHFLRPNSTTHQQDSYLFITRNDVNPPLYINQLGSGDIARFYKGSVFNSTSGTNQVTFTNNGSVHATGDVTAKGDLYAEDDLRVGYGHDGGAVHVEIGMNRTADGWSLIDLHGAVGADFNTRIVRVGGANGAFSIQQTGTGAFNLDGGNQFLRDGFAIWYGGNDGSGSGLDADLFDGLGSWQFLRGDAADTAAGEIGFSAGIKTDSIITIGGQKLTIGAGEAGPHMRDNAPNDEYLHIGGENGVRAYSSPDNMSSGFAGMHIATLLDSSGNTTLPGTLTAGAAHFNNAGSWSQYGVRISGAAPSIYFDQTDVGSHAFIGVNSNSFYVLPDTSGDGNFTSPYAMELNMSSAQGFIWGGLVWTQSNDGSGSGLDADSVDGIGGWQFLRSDTADTASGHIIFADGLDVRKYGNTHFSTGANYDNWLTNGVNGATTIRTYDGSSYVNRYRFKPSDLMLGPLDRRAMSFYDDWLRIGNGDFPTGIYFSNSRVRTDGWIEIGNNGGTFYCSGSNFTYYGNKVWHAGNDGSGSALDADSLDGYHAAKDSYGLNEVAVRNSSGDLHCRLVRSNFSTGASAPSTAQVVMRWDTSDNYLRPISNSTFMSWLNTQFNTADLLVGTSNLDSGSVHNSSGAVLKADGSNSFSQDGICLNLNRISSTGQILRFRHNLNIIGGVVCTTSSVSYNTSSDYRLKQDVVPLDGAADRVMALKPSRFAFKIDPETVVDGFLAHEAAEVVPQAVTGTKDGVGEDGEPEYQSMDHSKLVPLLTAALQDALTRIAALDARVSQLEGTPA